MFQSSAADSPVRCPSCPKRAIAEAATSDEESEIVDVSEIVDGIQRLVRERDSGRDIYPELTPLEFELIMLWDDYVDAYERAHKTRVNGLFEMLAGLAQARK